MDNKKYYLLDKKLHNSNSDFFRHKDLANNICDLIENNSYDSSYNIALIGKWGLGKSSLLEFVRGKLEEDQYKDRDIYVINAWKYEKEAIRIALLKSIIQSLDKSKNTKSFIVDIINKINGKNKNDKNIAVTFKKMGKFLLENWRFLVILAVITIVSGLVKIYVSPITLKQVIETNGFLWLTAKAIDFFIDNLLMNFVISIVLMFVTKKCDEIYTKIKTPIDISPLIDDTCFYEEMLDEILKNKKAIIILDDIDRLSHEKIIETLDALKILMDKPNLVFIIPFDDSIIKKALEKNTIDMIDPNHQIMQSELILDKLFKFKFYLNPLIPSDLSEYAIKLIDSEIPDIKLLINEDDIPVLTKILVHKGVETPREVKKIINIFISNLLVLKRRCGEKDVNNLLSYDGLKTLAKLSVLQADFNDFYDTLIINNDNIEELLKMEKETTAYDEKRYELKFLYDDKSNKLKIEYLQLLNFLNKTKGILHENISSYLYLNDSKISLKHTSKFNKLFSDTVESGNYKSTLDLMDKYDDLSDLMINVMEESEDDSLLNVVYISLKILSKKFSDNKHYADTLSRTINSMYSNNIDFNYNSEVSIKEIINAYNLASDNEKSGIEKLFLKYIDWMNVNKGKDDDLYDDLNILIENDQKYSENIKTQLKEFIYSVASDESFDKSQFFEKIKIPKETQLVQYFDMKLFNCFKDYFKENGIDSNFEKEWIRRGLSELIKLNKLTGVDLFIEDLYENESNIGILNEFTIDKIRGK
jgi:hypothetical protein